jgi:hypothetical protein
VQCRGVITREGTYKSDRSVESIRSNRYGIFWSLLDDVNFASLDTANALESAFNVDVWKLFNLKTRPSLSSIHKDGHRTHLSYPPSTLRSRSSVLLVRRLSSSRLGVLSASQPFRKLIRVLHKYICKLADYPSFLSLSLKQPPQ